MKTTPKIGIPKKKSGNVLKKKKKGLVPIQLKLDSYHFGLLVESQVLSDFLPPLQAQALLVFTQRKSRGKINYSSTSEKKPTNDQCPSFALT